jgi:hypothetical protein
MPIWRKRIVDAGTIVATAKGTLEVGKAAYAGWRWYEGWRMGKVVIDRPKNNTPAPPGRIDFEGRHEKAQGIYWLVGFRGDYYYPKCPVNLKPDGTWNEWASVGGNPGPREAVTGLFWVSDFMDSLLADIKKRSDESERWEPIRMKPPRDHMKLVQAIVSNVQ